MGKRDHLKDYVPTEDGGYEYVGTHWAWPGAEIRESFIRDSRQLIIAVAISLIAAGCIPAPGTFGAFYVVIPFAAAVIAAALVAAALIRLAREDDPMRDHVYAATIPGLPAKALVGAVASLACAAAALIHGLVLLFAASDEAAPMLSVMFALIMILAGVCLWRVRSDLAGIVFTREQG